MMPLSKAKVKIDLSIHWVLVPGLNEGLGQMLNPSTDLSIGQPSATYFYQLLIYPSITQPLTNPLPVCASIVSSASLCPFILPGISSPHVHSPPSHPPAY